MAQQLLGLISKRQHTKLPTPRNEQVISVAGRFGLGLAMANVLQQSHIIMLQSGLTSIWMLVGACTVRGMPGAGINLFMVLVGLAVAFFPARRAQKINPIEALRRE